MFSSAKTKINSILALNLHAILHGAAAAKRDMLSQFWIEETARFLWSCLLSVTPLIDKGYTWKGPRSHTTRTRQEGKEGKEQGGNRGRRRT